MPRDPKWFVDRALRLLIPLAIGAALVRWRDNPYWLGAAWSLAMLLSFSGWGAIVEYLVSPKRRVDVGMRVAWGVAATLAVGGVAVMFHLGSKPLLIAQTVIGCGAAVASSVLARDRLVRRRVLVASALRPGAYIVLSLGLIGWSFEWLGQLASNWTNPSDDQPLYYYLPQKLLQTGSLYDPFDVRRMTTYGGQFYLHAQYLVLGQHTQLNVVDAGLGTFVILLLVAGGLAHQRPLRRVEPGLLGLLLFFTLTPIIVRYNIGSLQTGVAMVLGVYRTIVWIDEVTPEGEPIAARHVAVLSACAVAACVLRTSNFFVVTMFVGVVLLARPLAFSRRFVHEEARRGVYDALGTAGYFCLIIAPWLIAFRESVGTFIYPLSHGNMTAGFSIVHHEKGFFFNLRHVVNDLAFQPPFYGAALILLAGLARGSRGSRTFVGALSVLCFFGYLLMGYMGGTFSEMVNARYVHGFLGGTLLAVGLSLRATRSSWVASPRGALLAAAVVVHLVLNREEVRKRLVANVDGIERATEHVDEEAREDRYRTDEYRDVEYHIPRGSTVGVVVDDPFRFDMKRYTILSLDQPGAMGPGGNFPVYKGPEALAHYLLAHGVRYLIVVDFHKSRELYDIEKWRGNARMEHSYLNYEAPIMLDVMGSLETLERTRTQLYANFNLFVIDLATPRPNG